jgi:hypothetical protein
VPDERDDRRSRLDERLRAQRGRRSRGDLADEVESIAGVRPSLDDFLSAEATDRLTDRSLIAAY